MSIQQQQQIAGLEARVSKLEQTIADLHVEVRKVFAAEPHLEAPANAVVQARSLSQAVRSALGRK